MKENPMLSIKDRGERKPDVVKPVADPDTVAALDKLLRWDVNLAKKDNEKIFLSRRWIFE